MIVSLTRAQKNADHQRENQQMKDYQIQNANSTANLVRFLQTARL